MQTTTEILKECNINSVSQILSNLDRILDLLKEDVRKVCFSRKYAVKDFDLHTKWQLKRQSKL